MNCLKCRVTPQDSGHQTCGHLRQPMSVAVKHGAGSLPMVWESGHSEKLQA
jgi:hypothetical protein